MIMRTTNYYYRRIKEFFIVYAKINGYDGNNLSLKKNNMEGFFYDKNFFKKHEVETKVTSVCHITTVAFCVIYR